MTLKTRKTGSIFHYYSPYWTSINVLNAQSTNSEEIDAKFASFYNVPFNEMLIRMSSTGYYFSSNYLVKKINATSMYEIFKLGSETSFANVGSSSDWKALIGTTASLHQACTRYVDLHMNVFSGKH